MEICTQHSSRTKRIPRKWRASKSDEEIFDYAVSLGGTITGEHGVGLAKKPFLRDAIGGASFELMKQLKRTLDPKGILNPGKIFD
jgi:glycolate oxidase